MNKLLFCFVVILGLAPGILLLVASIVGAPPSRSDEGAKEPGETEHVLIYKARLEIGPFALTYYPSTWKRVFLFVALVLYILAVGVHFIRTGP